MFLKGLKLKKKRTNETNWTAVMLTNRTFIYEVSLIGRLGRSIDRLKGPPTMGIQISGYSPASASTVVVATVNLPPQPTLVAVRVGLA